MLKSYLVIAMRHCATQKVSTAINVVGLAVGLACFILIGLFVRHELGYDRFFAKADRIYRVSRDFFGSRSAEAHLATMAGPAAALLEQDFPEVEKAARVSCCEEAVIAKPDGELFQEPGYVEADNELFAIFDFDWLRGDAATALSRPYTVVLTRSAAQKYFGAADPMGRTLLLKDRWPLEVTGVIDDLPENTHLKFSMLGSLLTKAAIQGDGVLESWSANRYYTYVLLGKGADVARLASGSGAFFERRFEAGSSDYTGFSVTALTDIHLRSHRDMEMKPPGSATTVYTFSAVAVLILLIACMNFTSLSTAQAVRRAKEIGVRKVLGAERRQVAFQFLAESVTLAIVAAVLAVTLVELALPWFDAFLEKPLALRYGNPGLVPALGALAVATGLAAGAYPSLYLSGFGPQSVLNGERSRRGGAAAFRKVLVVLQFSISIALLVATAVVYEQTEFARHLDLGYDKDHIVVVGGSASEGLGEHWDALKREWLADPEITSVTASNIVPGTDNPNAMALRSEGGPKEGRGMPFLWVDYGFFETYGIRLLAGRTFSEAHGDRAVPPADGSPGKAAYILNETAARQLGWSPKEAVGKPLELVGGAQGLRGTVVGVVADVYLESVRSPIKPMVYYVPPKGEKFLGLAPLQFASLRITGRHVADTLRYIDAKWKALVPDLPIARRFLDEDFEALYRGEEREGEMFTLFSGLAVFIACLGLFGLVSYTTERRTKEIGIRKVVGGGVVDIVRLVTAEFAALVVLANVLAWPVAYFLMRRWLAHFAYRIELGPLAFIGSGSAVLLIALTTVGVVAARAARARPTRALRYE